MINVNNFIVHKCARPFTLVLVEIPKVTFIIYSSHYPFITDGSNPIINTASLVSTNPFSIRFSEDALLERPEEHQVCN